MVSPQRQRQQSPSWPQKLGYWAVGAAAAVLRWIGIRVNWGQKPPEDAMTALESKMAEIEAFLKAQEEKEKRLIEKYGDEFLTAARRGDVYNFEIFLSFGMPVNYQHPQTGQTAMHLASARRARRIVRAILKTGKCDFLVRDHQGRLASELAHLYGRDPALARLLGYKERQQGDEQGVTVTLRPEHA